MRYPLAYPHFDSTVAIHHCTILVEICCLPPTDMDHAGLLVEICCLPLTDMDHVGHKELYLEKNYIECFNQINAPL